MREDVTPSAHSVFKAELWDNIYNLTEKEMAIKPLPNRTGGRPLLIDCGTHDETCLPGSNHSVGHQTLLCSFCSFVLYE